MSDDARGLVAKLQQRDLDDSEAALLGEVFYRAAEADTEVEGFAMAGPRDAWRGMFGSPTAQFKGSDEELQIIDWLGSLEAQR